jgi:hypothetical protein
MMKFHLKLGARAAALAWCLFAAGAIAQGAPPPDRAQLERKLASTEALIESSSAAKQIEASGIAEAAAQRSRARDLHRQAGVALRAGQLEAAARLLDEGSRAMITGVRLAASDQLVARKQRADFDARMDSTRALLEAQKRIATEKGAGARAGDVSKRVEAMMAQAAELARSGNLVEGRRALDQAYLAVKTAAIGLRDGDTVVRSLNFASKRDEYLYEIDRNDTHRMLVQMLLKDKRGSAGVDAMVEESMSAAATLRTKAEEQASRQEHDAAVRTLEQSTRELVKAIRGAGVYIPG